MSEQHENGAPLRVLIVGLGSIGQRHLRNLRALGPVEVVTHRRRGLPLPDDLADVPITLCASLGEALAHRPTAALVCAPPAVQLEAALAAAQSGCHLFIEKPIATSTDGLDALLAEVEARDLVTLIGFNLRFHPQLRQVKAWIDEGRLGRIVSARTHVGQWLPDWHPWEDYRQMYSARQELGGGAVLDLIHEIDALRWLLGDATSVIAMTGQVSRLEIDTEDVGEVVVRFESGAIGNVHVDYVQRGPTRGCHVIGDEGSVLWDFLGNELRIYEAKTGEWTTTSLDGYDRNRMYLDEMRHFLDCIAGRATPIVPLRAGIADLELALAAKRSSEEGRAVALR